jgi:outer membrane protein assembly factor BamB
MVAGLSASAQPPRARQFTQPPVPSTADLSRLNLEMSWYTYLPTDGRRDGIFSVQLNDDQILVLLRSGAVIALDPATGATRWRSRVGVPYVPPIGFGSNANLLLVAKGVDIFAMDRATGNLIWEFRLPNTASASPVVDAERFYVANGTNRLSAFVLPQPGQPGQPAPVAVAPEKKEERSMTPSVSAGRVPGRTARVNVAGSGVSGLTISSISAVSSGGQNVRSIGPLSSASQARQAEVFGPQPAPLWEYVTETRPETRVEQASILAGNFLLQVGANGFFFVISKFEPRIFYRYQADAAVSAPLGGYDTVAYIASEDFRVYALDIMNGKILWRFVTGGPIRQKPRVTDDSVYVTADRAGLYRLDRLTGDQVWRNSDADRFLAINNKFVYANDRTGRLLILDRQRGTEIAAYDGARDFTIPLSNELNDRLYLASNDGLLLCLHDRDYPKPLRVKNVVEEKPAAAPAEEKPRKPSLGPRAPAKPPAKPKTQPKEKDEGEMPDK